MAKIDRAQTPRIDLPRYGKEEIMTMYDRAMGLLDKGINTGFANAPQGMSSMLLMANLLHGGAYAAPINQRPYYLFDRTQSPYWAGYISHSKPGTGGLYDFLSALWGGVGSVSAADFIEEILVDSNVPHVLPKLIDDETYALFNMTYCQVSTTSLFTSAAGGLKTLVQAGESAANIVRGGGKEEPEGYSEASVQKLVAALARADTAAQDIGGD